MFDSTIPLQVQAKAVLELRRRERVARYFDRPDLFSLECFGIELWEVNGVGQRPIAMAIAEGAREVPAKPVTVRSGHKIGKTSLAAVIGWWWYFTRDEGRVVLTSSSFTQIEKQNWPEFAKLWAKAKFPLGGKMGETPRSGAVTSVDGIYKYIIGVSTDVVENIAGYSGAELLFLIDEASGIDEGVYEGIEGNMAGNAMAAMFGNPTQPHGTFYDSHHVAKDDYRVFHVESWNTPNAVTGENTIPGLATRQWCENRKARWGEKDPRYQVRVRGNFATAGEAVIFGEGWLDRVLVELTPEQWGRLDVMEGSERLNVGLDVARFGTDSTVLRGVRGVRAYDPRRLNKKDAAEIVTELADYCRECGADEYERPLVKVDTIGVGFAVYSLLRDDARFETVAVNGSERKFLLDGDGKPCESLEYANVRSDMHFQLRAWGERGGKVSRDRDLRTEMQVVRFGFDAKGKILVEDKKEIRKKIGRSPDDCDGLGLAVYEPHLLPGVVEYDSLTEGGQW